MRALNASLDRSMQWINNYFIARRQEGRRQGPGDGCRREFHELPDPITISLINLYWNLNRGEVIKVPTL